MISPQFQNDNAALLLLHRAGLAVPVVVREVALKEVWNDRFYSYRVELEPVVIERLGAVLGSRHGVPIGFENADRMTIAPFPSWLINLSDFSREMARRAYGEAMQARGAVKEKERWVLPNFVAGDIAYVIVHSDREPTQVRVLDNPGDRVFYREVEAVETGLRYSVGCHYRLFRDRAEAEASGHGPLHIKSAVSGAAAPMHLVVEMVNFQPVAVLHICDNFEAAVASARAHLRRTPNIEVMRIRSGLAFTVAWNKEFNH